MLNLIVEVLLYSCGDSQKCSSNDIAICTVMTLLMLSDVDDLSGVHTTMVHHKSNGKIVCTVLQGLKTCNQPGVFSIRVFQCLSQGSLIYQTY